MLGHRKIGFIGAGHMGQAIIQSLIDSKTVVPENIYVTNRSPGKLKKVEEMFKVNILNTNEELVDKCQIIVIAVKPQDLAEAIEPIATSFNISHLVISLAAGFQLKSLQKLLPNVRGLARVMPNAPAIIQRAVVGYCMASGAQAYEPLVQEILKPIGFVVPVMEGEPFEALTASCASGTGFVYELMIYWQEWLEERDFDSVTSRRMVVETFLGAALMAERSPEIGLNELQDRVVSKKGVTAAGLQSMRELEIERALRYSFEKAVIRDQELARGKI